MLRIIGLIIVMVIGVWLWDYLFPPIIPATFPQNPAVRQLSEAEMAYYQQVFDYTMEVTKPGEHYDWESYGGKGSFTPGDVFTSKSGATCRKFSERYTIAGSSGSSDAVACKRDGRDGWCRLKPADALTCAMESPNTMTEKGARGAGDAIQAAGGVLVKAKGLFR